MSNWRSQGRIVRLRRVRGRRRLKALEEFPGSAFEAPAGPSLAASLLLGAVFVGVAAGAVLNWADWWSGPAKPDAPIEWNAVQKVPTRAPDAADVEWEKRAQLEPSPSWGGLGGGVQTINSAADAAGPPPTTPTRGEARNDIRVIDGDTFVVAGETVRIDGIDAPETHPPRCLQEAQLGLAATQKLRELLSSGTITMGGITRDRYGRDVRQVFVSGVDVAQSMIAAGLASSYSGGKRQAWC